MPINSKEEIQLRAIEMYHANWKTSSIAKELGVHAGTVRRWFKKHNVSLRKNTQPLNEEDYENMTDESVMLAKHDARIEEEKTINEISESQNSPAEQYQHYIAAAGIKLARDSMKNIRGPKNVRELSELDQIIRRSLGLNSKTGGGPSSKMHIDISILNNRKADLGKEPIIDINNNDQ
tara:strand:+ start:4393 stop:4926 length:534 start_codon:yes stop_codon:yes gene_type:complete